MTYASIRVSVFVSAFLLFLIQPLIAKHLLPYFGGAYAVWSVVMFFFTSTLLLGYLYAGLLITWSRRIALLIHGALLCLSLLVLGWQVSSEGVPLLEAVNVGGYPIVSLLGSLIALVWLPTFVLTSTAIIAQFLYAKATDSEPYPLYGLSNIGSAAGLLTYPLVFEVTTTTHVQAWIWLALFGVFVSCLAFSLYRYWPTTNHVVQRISAIPRNRAAMIVVLAAIPVFLMIALTEYLAKGIASFPLLWVLPLLLYLLSFVVAFRERSWPVRTVSGVLGLVFLVVAQGISFYAFFSVVNYVSLMVVSLLSFFAIATFFHRTIYQLRPRVENLGSFYLLVSFGGPIGTALMSFVVPFVFVKQIELSVAIMIIIPVLCYYLWDEFLGHFKVWIRYFAVCSFLIIGISPFIQDSFYDRTEIAGLRNFYGAFSVYDRPVVIEGESVPVRWVANGSTVHGLQRLDIAVPREPTSYYGPDSGVEVAIEAMNEIGNKPRVAVVGLGAGVINVYCDQFSQIDYIDINPASEHIAETYFDYIQLCPEKTNIYISDGRLWLSDNETEKDKQYDIIILDAFTDDSIPIHLLTTEAVQDVYMPLLSDRGIIAVHVSNRFLNLRPHVAASIVAADLKPVEVITSYAKDEKLFQNSVWVLGANETTLPLVLQASTSALYQGKLETWSDAKSSILSAISTTGSGHKVK